MKKILIYILCILIITSAFSFTAFADEINTFDVSTDYEYYIHEDYDDAFATITKYNGDDTELIIPSEIEGHPVKEIGEYAFYRCKAESIVIPDTVEIIGPSAFSWSQNAASIIIPDSVLLICEDAFTSCTNVENFSIPSKIVDIADYAFYGCKKLNEVYIPESTRYIGSQIFAACDSLTSIKVDENNPYFDSRDNSNCIIETATNTIVCATNTSFIPDTAEHIGANAFSHCTKIKSIVIPSSVKTIGYEAFSYCTELKSLIIPENVEKLDANFTYSAYPDYIVIHNPECKIVRGYYHIGEFTTIYGYENSTAQDYAHTEFYDSPFVNIDDIIADVDANGTISVIDATLVQRAIAQLKTLSNEEVISADADKNGDISIMDATIIQLYLANIITEF